MPEPLLMSVHGMPTPAVGDADAQQRTRSGRLKMLMVLLVCAAPVMASYFTYYVLRPDGRTNYGELIDPQRPIPEALPLVTLDGGPVEPAALKGQWLLVVVAGGQCDAGCEQSLLLQRQLREALGRDRHRLDKVWLIDDEAQVRPEVRAALADALPLRVPAAALSGWLAPVPGQALSAHFYVVDPLGNWMMRFPADPDASRVRRDLGKLMRASSGWDKPGRP